MLLDLLTWRWRWWMDHFPVLIVKGVRRGGVSICSLGPADMEVGMVDGSFSGFNGPRCGRGGGVSICNPRSLCLSSGPKICRRRCSR